MVSRVRFSVTLGIALSLVGCAGYNPAPVSDLGHGYSTSARGEYRGSYYEVKQGDTLYFISYLTDKDVNDLIRFNNLKPPYTIYPGQRINLWRPVYRAPQYGQPSSSVPDEKPSIPQNKKSENHVVAAATSVATSAVAPVKKATGASASAVTPTISSEPSPKTLTKSSLNNSESEPVAPISKNKSDVVKKDPVKPVEPIPAKGYGNSISKENVKNKQVDTKPIKKQKVDRWLWPTKGRITSKFSNGDQGNKGIDIAGQRGQAVVATASGSVVYSGNALRGYGNLIIIKHNDDYLSAYAHNAQLLVKEGQDVIAGQKIATMGSSGANSVRLHFEIRYQGKSVNPSRYLP